MKGKLYKDGNLICDVRISGTTPQASKFEVPKFPDKDVEVNQAYYLEAGKQCAVVVVRTICNSTVTFESRLIFQCA